MATELEKILFKIEADTKQLTTGLKKAEAQTKSSTDKMTKAFGLFKGVLATTGVVVFGQQVVQASLSMDRITSALQVATGSTRAAKIEFEFISSEAERLGLNLESAATEYSRLAAASRGTKLEGEATRDVFVAVSEASAALGLSADQSRGALNALQQMISKGTVQAEELRGQLGERLPGAFQIAARAMGKTTQELGKMLELGQVSADELLPKLAEELTKTFGSQAEANSKKLRAEMERLNNAMFALKLAIGNSGLISWLTEGVRLARDLVDSLANIPNMKLPQTALNEALQTGDTKAQLEAIDDSLQSIVDRFAVMQNSPNPMLRSMAKFQSEGLVAEMEALLALQTSINDRRSQDGSIGLKINRGTIVEHSPDKKRNKFFSGLASQEVERLAEMEQTLSDVHQSFRATEEVSSKFWENARENIATIQDLTNQQAQWGLVTDENNAMSQNLIFSQKGVEDQLEKTMEQWSKTQAILERAKTPLDKYDESMNMLEEAVRSNAIEQWEYNKAVAQVEKEWEAATAATQRTTEEVRLFGSAISTAMEDAIFQGKGLREVMGGLLQDIGRIIFRLTVTKTLETALGGFSLGNLLGSANGNVFSGGNPIAFAKGGVVGGPTTFPMNNGKVGLMGEAGPEAIMPLKRGPGGKLGVASQGGSGAGTVFYIDARGSNSDEGVFRIVNRAINKATPGIVNSSVKKVQKVRKSDPSFFKGA